jgi:hypothetical protein
MQVLFIYDLFNDAVSSSYNKFAEAQLVTSKE